MKLHETGIVLTKSGYKYKYYDDEGELKSYNIHFLQEALWNSIAEVESDVTLRDVLKPLQGTGELWDMLLQAPVNKILGEGFSGQATPVDLDYVFVHKHIEIVDKEISDSFCFDGKGQGTYGLDLCPLSSLIDLPFRLNTEVKVSHYDSKYKNIKQELYICEDFKLIEVLYAIFFELSFYGDPNQQEEVRAGLKQAMTEMDLKYGE